MYICKCLKPSALTIRDCNKCLLYHIVPYSANFRFRNMFHVCKLCSSPCNSVYMQCWFTLSSTWTNHAPKRVSRDGHLPYPVLYPVVSIIIPCMYVCTRTVHCITYAHMYVLVAFKVASQGTFGTLSLSLSSCVSHLLIIGQYWLASWRMTYFPTYLCTCALPTCLWSNVVTSKVRACVPSVPFNLSPPPTRHFRMLHGVPCTHTVT